MLGNIFRRSIATLSIFNSLHRVMATITNGVYSWKHPSGEFNVHLRNNGVFYCKDYPAAAKWMENDSKLQIDWKNYGSYELMKTSEIELEGSVVGQPSKWRKMSFQRPFTEMENLIMGEGGGSVWDFQWEKGNFEVEFRTDGLNHFVCSTFPAHRWVQLLPVFFYILQ